MIAVVPLETVTVKGKLAEVFGVFVPFCTCNVIPLVSGISTGVLQVTEPVQVSKTMSPSLAELTATWTFACEHDATVMVDPDPEPRPYSPAPE
jgi:hypothetical protein